MSGYLCPVCRAPRNTDLRDHISGRTHLQIALITLACIAVLYFIGGPQIGWKGILFYLPMWAGSEFFHWAKMREATKCRSCDFDPVLYQRDPLAARRQVEAKLNVFVDDLKLRLQQKSPLYIKNQAANAAAAASEVIKAGSTGNEKASAGKTPPSNTAKTPPKT